MPAEENALATSLFIIIIIVRPYRVHNIDVAQTVTIDTTKQLQYLPKISDVSATTVAFFELITLC